MKTIYKDWYKTYNKDWDLSPISFYKDLYKKHADKIYENNLQKPSN